MYQLSFAVTTCLKTESVKLATIHLACNSVNRLGGLFILAGFAGLSVVHVSSQLADMLGWLVYDGLAWDNWDLYSCSLLSSSKSEVDHVVAGFQ